MTYEIFIRLIAPYHAVLVHFPVAIWTTVSLIVIYRALFDNALSRAGDRILVPLLALSIVAGIAAYTAGFIIFPVDATTASPLIRNHLLAASWSLAYWTVFLITRWLNGESVWVGAKRWIMLGLALLPFIHLSVYFFRTLHPEPIVLKPSAPSLPGPMLLTLLFSFGVFTLLYVGFVVQRYALAELREQAEAAHA